MAANLAGRLESAAVPILSEKVSITNISGHGARVMTRRHWQPNDHVVLMELTGDFHAYAEVIYCQRLPDEAYVVGLKFVGLKFAGATTETRLADSRRNQPLNHG
jgi:hypothetical protein